MKTFFTRALALALIIFTLVSMVACSGSNAPTGTPDTGNNGNTDNGGNTGDNENNGNVGDNGNNENNGSTDNGGNTDTVVDTREEVDFNALVESLTSSKYSANIKTSDFVGLSDPSLIGINEASLNDVLYPIPADADCSLVINVKDYGVTPDSADCSTGLKDAIKAVKGKEGTKKIVFPEGDYKFAKTLVFEDLEDVYVCGEGNDKRFSITMTNWTPGIKVNNCTNIHFNNYDFDYLYPSAVTGVVVSSTENSVVLKVDDGYDLTYKSYNGAGFPASRNGCYLEYVIDEETGRYVPNRNGNFFLSVNGRHDITGGSYDADKNQMTLNFEKGKMKPVEAGVKVTWAYTYYEYAAFEAVECKNLYLEGVNIYHAMGMAMGINKVENTYLNRVQETVRNGRLLMGTADGLHASSCKGEMVITNSVFEYSHDDAFNIKGWYGKVVANTPKSVSYDTSKEIDVEVGDVLDFYSTTTFEYLGSFTVKKVDKAKSKYDFVESIGNLDLTGAYIANDTQINSFTMKNTYVGNKRCRGMLIQCRDILIEGCTFQNVINGTMLIHSVADVFAEGIVPRNIVIRNNKFLDNYDCDIYVYTKGSEGSVAGTITGVEISNNFFWSNENEPGYSGWWYGNGAKICYKSAGDSKITNNFFYYFNERSKILDIRLSENITVSDNYAKGTATDDNFKFVAVKESNTTNIVQNNNVLDIIERE